nr:tyrosine-type recombinase/integrase [Polaromonas sp. E3S]
MTVVFSKKERKMTQVATDLPRAKRSLSSESLAPSVVFVRRLGSHHFAYLRAIAEGLEAQHCAKRYLGLDHGHQVKNAHQQTVAAVRAVARRAAEPAWRLIGLTITSPLMQTGALIQPTLEEFIEEHNLDGWREAEVLEMFQEAHPTDTKKLRRERLRERQLDLLRRLQAVAAETPAITDSVAGWFDDTTAGKLIAAGLTTLDDLRARIARGGRWFSVLPGIGQTKAIRIAQHLGTLVPAGVKTAGPVFKLVATPSLFSPVLGSASASLTPITAAPLLSPLASLELAPTTPTHQPVTLLAAKTDLQAVEAWIAARAGALATGKSYRREASRLLLWLQYERLGKPLSSMRVEDCMDYMAFLQNIPERWISRERAAPGTIGWAPFKGPLSLKSHKQAVIILAGLFSWLQDAQYLAANPWALVNKKTGDDKAIQLLDTKALSEDALTEVIKFIKNQTPSPSASRALFIFRFIEAVGLRSAEILGAKLGDIRKEPEGWVMQVHGKGSKNRIVALPGQAIDALQEYLKSRQFGALEFAPAIAPLLASTLNPMESVGYQALYEHVKVWLSRAMRQSALPYAESATIAKASTHWLRHTFGTRAIARGVPLDVIQAQMGHASIQTTTAIYGRAPLKRRSNEMEKAFSLVSLL